jgi:Uncharacterized protein conserved in bacteria
MAITDKIKKFIDGEDDPKGNNEFYKESFKDAAGGSKMVLIEPRAYSESQQIADYLKKRSAVVVNLKRVTPDVAKRIVDFLGGAVYALEGDMQKLGNGIFLCTPNNVNVEGKMSGDEKVKSKKDNEEFDW